MSGFNPSFDLKIDGIVLSKAVILGYNAGSFMRWFLGYCVMIAEKFFAMRAPNKMCISARATELGV